MTADISMDKLEDVLAVTDTTWPRITFTDSDGNEVTFFTSPSVATRMAQVWADAKEAGDAQ